MTMSVPYGLPSTCPSIQLSSMSSSSGVYASAPSTPKPPARLTAATTSRQCENAKIGNSIPRSSAIGVFMRNDRTGLCLTRSTIRGSATSPDGEELVDSRVERRLVDHVDVDVARTARGRLPRQPALRVDDGGAALTFLREGALKIADRVQQRRCIPVPVPGRPAREEHLVHDAHGMVGRLGTQGASDLGLDTTEHVDPGH